jgi:hypothetical protein
MASAVVTSPLRVRVPSGAYTKSCRLSAGGPSLQVTAPEHDSDNSPPRAQDTSLNRNLQSPLLRGALLMCTHALHFAAFGVFTVVKTVIIDFMPCSLVGLLTYRISEREDGGSLYRRKLCTAHPDTRRPRRLLYERLLLTSNVLFYIVIFTPRFI